MKKTLVRICSKVTRVKRKRLKVSEERGKKDFLMKTLILFLEIFLNIEANANFESYVGYVLLVTSTTKFK